MTDVDPAAGPVPGRETDLADAVAEATLAVPGVHALHGGGFGEVATYLPGRRVRGVRLDGDRVEVHVVVDLGAPVVPTAEAVRAAVRPLVDGAVDVTVEDVAVHDPAAPEAPVVPPATGTVAPSSSPGTTRRRP